MGLGRVCDLDAYVNCGDGWGDVVVFESADFFMDQTYFSVCWYVIIKDK